MRIAAELKYTKDHKLFCVEDNLASLGITEFASAEIFFKTSGLD